MLATDHNLFVCFVSQSLVPILCQACSVPAAEVLASGHHEHPRRHVERILTSTGIERTRFIGRGCAQCENKGTVGRELVAEVIRTNSEIMDAIRAGDKAAAMLSWLAEGNQTKRMVALDKAKQGLIDPLVAERHVGELAVLDRNGKPKPLRDVLSYGYRVTALGDVDDAARGPG